MHLPLVLQGKHMNLLLVLEEQKAPNSAYIIRGALLHKLQGSNGAKIKLCYSSRHQSVLPQCQVKPLQ